MSIRSLAATLLVCLALAAAPVHADDTTRPIADVLNLDASVSSDVAPDLAVVTMAIVREGPDVPPLTKDVDQVLAKAFADARAVPGIVASNGGYTTQPRYDTRAGGSTRNGWTVRATIVLKSKDFDALGNLVGRLAQTLQIDGSGFELSPELRSRENAALIDRGARAFQERATAATKAFGYAGFGIRQVTVGAAGEAPFERREMKARMAVSSASPLPIEPGQVTLTLSVSGSVQMRR